MTLADVATWFEIKNFRNSLILRKKNISSFFGPWMICVAFWLYLTGVAESQTAFRDRLHQNFISFFSWKITISCFPSNFRPNSNFFGGNLRNKLGEKKNYFQNLQTEVANFLHICHLARTGGKSSLKI